MRVVHVICSDRFAGVEQHVARLAVAQADLGTDVRVIGGEPARMSRELASHDIPFAPARSVLDATHAVLRWREADVFHAHMTFAEASLLPPQLASHAELITTRHFAQRRGSSQSGRLAAVAIRRRFTRQIAVSRFVSRHIDGDSEVIYAGVPSQDPSPTPRQPFVLVAQRLEPEKATELALDAFAKASIAKLGWTLRIAGDGTVRPDLEAYVRRKEIPNVEFLGHRSDVPDLMTSAGIFLATAPREPFGLSVVEAMSHGVPVIAARGGGHNETVGLLQNPRLYDSGDATAAGHHLHHLATNLKERTAYGASGRAMQQQRFTLAAQAHATNQFYKRQ